MKSIIEKLNLDDRLNKNYSYQKKFNKVWLEIPHEKDYNEMADLIEFVKSPSGFKYLFVIVDLYTLKFDCEPIKAKSSKDVLDAMLKCFQRNYVKKPFASISTDGGTEFKSVFHKWVFDQNIYHKEGVPYRHKQQSVVESVNNQITRLVMLYINKKSKELKKEFTNWVEVIPDIRKYLNEYRENIFKSKVKRYKDYNIVNQNITTKPKFHIGQMVHYKLDYPENFNMEKQATPTFRNGDYRYSTVVRKITKVIFMNSYPYYRYMLEHLPNVSFSEYELLPSEQNYSTYKVKKIIDKKIEKRKTFYLIWWLGYKKSESTWEPEKQLIEDGLKDNIDEFNKEYNENLQKQRDKLKK